MASQKFRFAPVRMCKSPELTTMGNPNVISLYLFSVLRYGPYQTTGQPMGEDESQPPTGDSTGHGESPYTGPGLPPSPSRLIEVASGLSEWTPEEKAYLAMHPKWIEHALRMRQTLRDLRLGEKPDSTEPGTPPEGFVNRLRQQKDAKDHHPGSDEGPFSPS